MNTYCFRAECQLDVSALRKILGTEISKITMTIKAPYPDTEVEFDTELTVNEVKDAMRTIQDGHVMYETISPEIENTGVRRYEE